MLLQLPLIVALFMVLLPPVLANVFARYLPFSTARHWSLPPLFIVRQVSRGPSRDTKEEDTPGYRCLDGKKYVHLSAECECGAGSFLSHGV
jgi:hypothetical protein